MLEVLAADFRLRLEKVDEAADPPLALQAVAEKLVDEDVARDALSLRSNVAGREARMLSSQHRRMLGTTISRQVHAAITFRGFELIRVAT